MYEELYMNRIGIIEIGNNEIKVIGFGVVTGTEEVFDAELGLDLTVTKVKLDNGNEITVRDASMGDEDAIKKEISIYKGNGYKIIS